MSLSMAHAQYNTQSPHATPAWFAGPTEFCLRTCGQPLAVLYWSAWLEVRAVTSPRSRQLTWRSQRSWWGSYPFWKQFSNSDWGWLVQQKLGWHKLLYVIRKLATLGSWPLIFCSCLCCTKYHKNYIIGKLENRSIEWGYLKNENCP